MPIELAAETGCRLHVVHVSTAQGMQTDPRGAATEGSTSAARRALTTCSTSRTTWSDSAASASARRRSGPRPTEMACGACSRRRAADGRLGPLAKHPRPEAGRRLLARSGAASRAASRRASCCSAQARLDLRDGGRGHGDQRRAAIRPAQARARSRRDSTPTCGSSTSTHEDVVRREDLLYRNPFSAHEGQPIRGRTVRTIVRGETVFADGKPATSRAGASSGLREATRS